MPLGPQPTPLQRWFFASVAMLASIALTWILLRLLSRVVTAITVLLVGATLAYLLAPVADRLEMWVRKRWLAVLILMFVLAVVLFLSLVLIMGPLIADLLALVEHVPDYVQQVEAWLHRVNEWLASRGIGTEVEQALTDVLESARSNAPEIVVGAVSVLAKIGTGITEMVLSIVVATYLLLEGRGIGRRIYRLLPPASRHRFKEFELVVAQTVGGYVRGQLLLGLIIGLVAGVGMAFLGLPYPVFLGVVAGVFELVPNVGAVLGALPAVFIAAFESLPKMLVVAGYFFIIQQIESLVLVPRITQKTVGLHPVVALLALVAGFEVAGIVGALLAVPVVAAGWTLLMLWLPDDPDPPGEPVDPTEPRSISHPGKHRDKA